MIYFTSDTHFSDENCRRYRYRPFATVEEMNEQMVSRWNSVVGENDVVYHLGDFAISNEDIERYAPLLNGEVHLLIGNHDQKKDRNLINDVFHEVHDDPFVLEIPGEIPLWVCHYPLQRRSEIGGIPCYCASGHIHDLWKISMNMVNVGVDCWNFAPISIDVIFDSHRCEIEGRWDANVYPDAPLEWQWEVSNIRERAFFDEPTIDILRKRIEDLFEQIAEVPVISEKFSEIVKRLKTGHEKFSLMLEEDREQLEKIIIDGDDFKSSKKLSRYWGRSINAYILYKELSEDSYAKMKDAILRSSISSI